ENRDHFRGTHPHGVGCASQRGPHLQLASQQLRFHVRNHTQRRSRIGGPSCFGRARPRAGFAARKMSPCENNPCTTTTLVVSIIAYLLPVTIIQACCPPLSGPARPTTERP